MAAGARWACRRWRQPEACASPRRGGRLAVVALPWQGVGAGALAGPVAARAEGGGRQSEEEGGRTRWREGRRGWTEAGAPRRKSSQGQRASRRVAWSGGSADSGARWRPSSGGEEHVRGGGEEGGGGGSGGGGREGRSDSWHAWWSRGSCAAGGAAHALGSKKGGHEQEAQPKRWWRSWGWKKGGQQLGVEERRAAQAAADDAKGGRWDGAVRTGAGGSQSMVVGNGDRQQEHGGSTCEPWEIGRPLHSWPGAQPPTKQPGARGHPAGSARPVLCHGPLRPFTCPRARAAAPAHCCCVS